MSDELKRYYRRTTSGAVAETEEVRLEFHGANPTSEADLKKSLYLRSAYRHDPSFQNTTIESPADVLDRHAVRRLTDTDQTVPNNYQRIIWRLLVKLTNPGLMTDDIIAEVKRILPASPAPRGHAPWGNAPRPARCLFEPGNCDEGRDLHLNGSRQATLRCRAQDRRQGIFRKRPWMAELINSILTHDLSLSFWESATRHRQVTPPSIHRVTHFWV